MRPARFALAVVVLVAGVGAAHAGLFDDEEARKQIAATTARLDTLQKNLEARLADLEQQAKGQGLDLLRDLEGIKADVAKIRGQIEVLTYELTEAQKRQRDLYVDLDSRLRKIEAAGAGAPSGDGGAGAAAGIAAGTPGGPLASAAPSAGAVAPQAPPAPAPIVPVTAAEQRAYDAALDQFKRGDYQGAIGGFSGFVKTYPKSLLAPSAQYWVGNAQYARRDYRGAIASQRQLIQAYPDSPKVADALLNIASAQAEMGDNATARRTLTELVDKFPQSEAAGKAKQRLGGR
ncbi:MAG: tol-pal system protein YbgF [Burkholderiales bacterium]|nr:tol-pal system protein YbgF [Burkholderiales bacterium]